MNGPVMKTGTMMLNDWNDYKLLVYYSARQPLNVSQFYAQPRARASRLGMMHAPPRESRIGRVPTLRKWRSGRCVLALAVEDPPKPQWKYRCIASSGQLLWLLLLVRFFTILRSPDWPGVRLVRIKQFS